MGFDEAEGQNLDEVVAELVEAYGSLDHELSENIENPWRRDRPDVIKLHRLWLAKRLDDGSLCICAADIEEYEKPPHVYKLIALESGPWGPPCPRRIIDLLLRDFRLRRH